MASPPANALPATNRRSRLRDRTLLFRFMAEINLILGAWYLWWRLGNSIAGAALWIAIPLFLAEVYSYIGRILFAIELWRPLERQVRSLDQLTPPLPISDYPSVDIFINCNDEPLEVVEQTAQAALAMDYPATKLRVYVLGSVNKGTVSAELQSMVQTLNQEDLRSPPLQEAAADLAAERQRLIERLNQLQRLEPDAQQAEAFLQDPTSAEVMEAAPGRWLKTLQDLVLLLSPHQGNLRDRLLAEHHQLKAAIQQQEVAATELARCHYIDRAIDRAPSGDQADPSSGSFILTLDASHIPKPEFLKRVLPYFYTFNLWTGKYHSSRIAFVQTPQNFYNLPPGDPLGHRAYLFQGSLQQGKDGFNAAAYTGTNAVLRREALLHVCLPPAPEETGRDRCRELDLVNTLSSRNITEDLKLALRLHAAGWRSIYHSEQLAAGLAPTTLSLTLRQHLRQSQGTIQAFRQENPLTTAGLSFWQRLHYFQTMYRYFSGFATLVFLACPILYLFMGILPINAYSGDFALRFVPMYVVNRLTFTVAAWGIPAWAMWRSEQYRVTLFPVFIQAVLSALITRFPNRLPLEKASTRRWRIYLQLAFPQVLVFGLTLSAFAWSIYERSGPIAPITEPAVYLFNAAWAIYNLALLGVILRASLWKPQAKR